MRKQSFHLEIEEGYGVVGWEKRTVPREPHAQNTRRFPTPPGFARSLDQFPEDCIFPKEALLKRVA